MPTRNVPASHAATCEEWDEVAQATLPDTRTSANVAAKRSKPELVPYPPHNKGIVDGDAKNAIQAARDGRKCTSPQKESKPVALTLDTSLPERRRRLYSSGPPAECHRDSISRTAARQSPPKMESARPMMRHAAGQCFECDSHGYHVAMAQSPSTSSQEPAKRPPSVKTKAMPAPQPRPIRSQSHNGTQRPMSFHAGMSTEAYHIPYSTPYGDPWLFTPSSMSPYAQLPCAPVPVSALPHAYQEYSQPFFMPPTQQIQYTAFLPRPVEVSQGRPARRDPPIKEIPARESRTKTTSRERRPSRTASQHREDDARRMPPPYSKHAARRPSIVKTDTGMATPISHTLERDPSTHRSVPTVSPSDGRRPEVLPRRPSHREPPPSAYPVAQGERRLSRKSTTGIEPVALARASSSGPLQNRRSSFSSAERHEVEAESYQRARGTRSQALTVDAVRKIPRQTDNGSQRSINSSSRGSSGGKTKATTASNDLTMTYNGVTLGISGDSAEHRSIKIQPQRHGGMQIRVDEIEGRNYENPIGLLKSGTSTTSSKQSRQSSSDKEMKTSRGHSSERDGGRISRRPS